MKYLYFGVAILALILAGCIVMGIALDARTQMVLSPLEDAAENARLGNYEAAVASAAEAADQWNSHLHFFSSVLCHDETDVITEGFAALKVMEDAEFRQACAELMVRLHHIAEMDLPLPHNIL